VNAAWWIANVQVPLANLKYQDYIDGLIQRSKKYGSYVLIVKAGQFPDLPCGATDAEYAAQSQLLGSNLVRILVNAAWWIANVQVPLANLKYQDYIDGLIQRSKKYGSYVLVVK